MDFRPWLGWARFGPALARRLARPLARRLARLRGVRPCRGAVAVMVIGDSQGLAVPWNPPADGLFLLVATNKKARRERRADSLLSGEPEMSWGRP